jgi:hypothetical protein
LKLREYLSGSARRFSHRIVDACFLICALALGGTSLRAQAQPVSTGRVLPGTANGADHLPAGLDSPASALRHPNQGTRLWKVSLAALTTANLVDIHSSWGKPELNPVLGLSSGRFGWHAALVKAAISGAVMGVEYLATRGHRRPSLYRALSIANFGSVAAVGAVAAHNYTLPSR